MSGTLSVKQAEFLPQEQAAPDVFFEQLERTTGDYTAERLRSKRPEDYKLILAMLANNYGSQKIQDEFHKLGKKMSKNTVKAVRAIEGETIDRLRERLAGEAFVAADDYREAAMTALNEIMSDPKRRKKLTIRDVQSLEVASGIATQNGQLLAGLPTSRVELTDLKQPDHDDFNRQLKNLPSISIDPATPVSTHLVEETAGQKEGAANGKTVVELPSATTMPVMPKAVAEGSTADSKSEGERHKTQ